MFRLRIIIEAYKGFELLAVSNGIYLLSCAAVWRILDRVWLFFCEWVLLGAVWEGLGRIGFDAFFLGIKRLIL